jgi:hypothetical protein
MFRTGGRIPEQVANRAAKDGDRIDDFQRSTTKGTDERLLLVTRRAFNYYDSDSRRNAGQRQWILPLTG